MDMSDIPPLSDNNLDQAKFLSAVEISIKICRRGSSGGGGGSKILVSCDR
jgi:hypothetical protein